ncbi:pachytene checkpoint protein 2 homolog [Ctenocephalides felis]|uniref:pachytene checkpoint protein 2 homolog n=1 Tax=Ctenocephalides felis TaxID=7515 RepID=UPI000E6E580E|nr:pachytene checkpoint protein 2 homolog [Ctenocephalides felis]
MSADLHVEILQKNNSAAAKNDILQIAKVFLNEKINVNILGTVIGPDTFLKFNEEFLYNHVESITICNENKLSGNTPITDNNIIYHVYRLDEAGSQAETIEDYDDDTGSELSTANHWVLPSVDFHGLWESLIYEIDIKENLLKFVESTLLFSDKNVDSNIITWNRVVLLHGPPGTGKTSLCKALAQKLSIRMSDRYTHGQLIEINSHSLFSKWFSESGKLVMKMFRKIREMINDPQALVCVLIDEVESLTHARQSSLSGTEPSDSIRVVNAVLTQIDQIRQFPNVLILTTSNINGAIDLAFVDRADIKQYISLPSPVAIYEIYRTCINELIRVGLISKSQDLLNHHIMKIIRNVKDNENSSVSNKLSLDLYNIAEQSVGMSGRTLRKIPFLAHALYFNKSSTTMEDFLEAMLKAIVKQHSDTEVFMKGVKEMSVASQ